MNKTKKTALKVDEPAGKVNYGPVSAVLVTIGSFLLSQILAVIAVSLVPAVLGWDKTRSENWIGSDSPVPSFLIVSLVAIINIWIISFFLTRRRTPIKLIGLGNLKLKHIGMALVGLVVYIAIYLAAVFILSVLIPSLNLDQEQDLGFAKSAAGLSLLLVFVSLVLIPPLVEEIIMRGFFFTGLRTKLSFLIATILTSLLFAAAHLPEGKDGLLWVGAVDTFILSAVLCYLREKSGSLWPAIGVHMFKNAIAFFVIFDVIKYFGG